MPAHVHQPKSPRKPLRSYRELRAWQAAMQLARDVYTLTARFPAGERFGLTAQLRRASVSVPSNIAEGYGRHTRGDHLRALAIARGSVAELETQLLLIGDLGMASREVVRPVLATAESVGRQLNRLDFALRRTP